MKTKRIERTTKIRIRSKRNETKKMKMNLGQQQIPKTVVSRAERSEIYL